MPAELHCHTLFSVDGRGTPEEVVEAAAEAGITTLALTDHNNLGGLARGRARAERLGLDFIDGMELDAKWDGRDCHLLAFGFDPDDSDLAELAAENSLNYARNFEPYLSIFERRGYGLTREDLARGLAERYPTHPAPVLNKWYAREVLMARGVFPDRETALREMSEVARQAERDRPDVFWDFASLEETRRAVHGAGGVLLLAHPANGIPGDLDGQLARIRGALEAGLDGFELYHPSGMREPHFNELIAEAARLGCAVSGGSDVHNLPGRRGEAPRGGPVPDEVVASIEAALRRRRAKP